MTSRLGIYWSVAHRRPQDYDFFRRLHPTVMKVMDGGYVDYKWIRENLPDALVVARIHALSEQHDDMLRDPIGTGQRHAEEWHVHQKRLGFDRGNTLILGINEPRIWEPGVPEALRLYTISLCNSAVALGLRVGAMQLSVGWPNNTGDDTPPDWSPWHGVEEAIQRGRHMLVLHEYWADNGPGENWGWWAGRSLKCPWQVPIVIGECGIDMQVKDGSVAANQRGWQGRMHPTRYAQELADYVGRMSVDSRFVGCAVFASDFASREWYSFDIEPAYQAILATPIPDVKPETKPIETHLPSIQNGKPTAIVDAPAGANIRRGPGVDFEAIGVEVYGQELPVVGKNAAGDWWRVATEFGSGWVNGMIVKVFNVGSVSVVETPAPVNPAPIESPGIIDPVTALAFLDVESGNNAFVDNLLTIRFEVHVFKKELGNDELFNRHFQFNGSNYNEQFYRPFEQGDWKNVHGGMAQRHQVLNFARLLSDTAALRSTGMGMAQVMGSNHARIGYATPQAMFNAFSSHEYGVNAQLMGFVDYVLSDPGLLTALKERDWWTAVQKYNGTGQEQLYINLLEDALEKIQRKIGA